MSVKIRYARILTCVQHGMDVMIAEMEVSILPGLPSVDLVGLCDSSIRDSKERVRSAIRQAGYSFPSARVTVGISPAYLQKSGSHFDLPLALCLLIASGQIKTSPDIRIAAFGELTITGLVRDTPGVLSSLSAVSSENPDIILVPAANLKESKLLGIEVRTVCSLKDAIDKISPSFDTLKNLSNQGLNDTDNESNIYSNAGGHQVFSNHRDISGELEEIPDFSLLKGQEKAGRALVLSAAGFHNLILIGSPGSGKTTAASILRGLLPPLTTKEKIQLLQIRGISQKLEQEDLTDSMRPFRYVHHSCTATTLIGDKRKQLPGEIAYASHGILFLDEMAEFSTRVLDLLRQPLENRSTFGSESDHYRITPSHFLLLGAMNPCRCGRILDSPASCTCDSMHRRTYERRISGPLLDRIDLFCEMYRVEKKGLYESVSNIKSYESVHIREEISRCWNIQAQRCLSAGLEPALNGEAFNIRISELFRIPEAVLEYSASASDRLNISARGLNKLLRVSRTIADLEGMEDVCTKHIAEALLFRRKESDRETGSRLQGEHPQRAYICR